MGVARLTQQLRQNEMRERARERERFALHSALMMVLLFNTHIHRANSQQPTNYMLAVFPLLHAERESNAFINIQKLLLSS
jgi:hypothetical protein